MSKNLFGKGLTKFNYTSVCFSLQYHIRQLLYKCTYRPTTIHNQPKSKSTYQSIILLLFVSPVHILLIQWLVYGFIISLGDKSVHNMVKQQEVPKINKEGIKRHLNVNAYHLKIHIIFLRE